MAGPMVGPLLERLGLEMIKMYWTPDGEFPDHEPNPLLPENREAIIEKVRESGADLGIAWDGDADRCFFIDDTGEFVDGDFLTALLAESLLRKNPNPAHPEAILYDVRASWAVPTRSGARAGRPRQPRGARVLQDAHAQGGSRCSAGRSPGTTTSATSTARTRARPGAFDAGDAFAQRQEALGAAGALPREATSSPARSTRRSATSRRR